MGRVLWGSVKQCIAICMAGPGSNNPVSPGTRMDEAHGINQQCFFKKNIQMIKATSGTLASIQQIIKTIFDRNGPQTWRDIKKCS